jgi:tRNA1Val (adenine37-N6)-methyltransferase
MSNNWFQFKEFKILQEQSAMKVGVDSVLFGACITYRLPENILDIGSGTGLLSFMAFQRTGAKITAVEIEELSYQENLNNVKLNDKQNDIEVIQDSFQHFAEYCSSRFDHIISNPPWFNNSYESPIEKRNSARQNTILTCTELLNGVDRLLTQTGIFSVIVPFDNDTIYRNEAAKRDLFCFNRIMIRPNQNKSHHRVILEFSRRNEETKTSEVCIRDYHTGQYTEEYIGLTNDFYLDKHQR